MRLSRSDDEVGAFGVRRVDLLERSARIIRGEGAFERIREVLESRAGAPDEGITGLEARGRHLADVLAKALRALTDRAEHVIDLSAQAVVSSEDREVELVHVRACLAGLLLPVGQPLEPVGLTRRSAAAPVATRTAGERGDDDEQRYLTPSRAR